MTTTREATVKPADYTNVRMETIDRLTNSVNGNPRFRIAFVRADGTYLATHNTQTDASCNYEVTNFARKPVNVWLSKRGTVEYLTEVG